MGSGSESEYDMSHIFAWSKPVTEESVEKAKLPPGGAHLSYHFLLILSVLGGYLALDHLYLRSPRTFFAKLLVNVFFFGIWWFYDALQALFQGDVVKVFGLSVPFGTEWRVGTGSLMNDKPDEKHLRFFMYGVSLLFFGLFGADSFVVGQREYGFIRLFSMLSIIGIPLAIGWWFYHIYHFTVNTKDVVYAHADFFGAPVPSVLEKAKAFVPSWILSYLPSLFHPVENMRGIVEKIAEPVIEPVLQTAQTAMELGQTGLHTVQQVVKEGEDVISVASKAINTAKEVADTGLGALGAVSQLSEIQRDAVNQLTKVTKGGSQHLNIQSYFLIAIIAILSISSFLTTYYRYQNVSQNDAPPEPRVFRGVNREEPTESNI